MYIILRPDNEVTVTAFGAKHLTLDLHVLLHKNIVHNCSIAIPDSNKHDLSLAQVFLDYYTDKSEDFQLPLQLNRLYDCMGTIIINVNVYDNHRMGVRTLNSHTPSPQHKQVTKPAPINGLL